MKWTKVGENLVRHPAGTIYLRAKIGGQKVRQSLHTTDLRAAKRKRDLLLEDLRHAAALGDQNIETLADALAIEKGLTIGKPKLKQATKDYYEHLFLKLEASIPGSHKAATWTAEEARKWWSTHCKDNTAPQHANNALAIVRRMMRLVVERGIRRDDPTKGIKRLKIPKTRIDDMPTTEQMDGIIASIRMQKLRHSEEVADMIEFLAWSGLRIGELRALRWKDISDDWVTVTGGATGTKNHEIHQVPLNARLRAVLGRRERADDSMPVFHLASPRIALENACKRLGLRHMRVHDLRHWFTSHCIEIELMAAAMEQVPSFEFIAAYEISDMVGRLASSSFEAKDEARADLASLRKARLLLIDDLGKGRMSPSVAAELFALIDHRYCRALPTIWTANTEPDAFAVAMPVDIAAPFAGRLNDSSRIVRFR